MLLGIELCHWYGKTEEEFGDMWVAFCLQHKDGNFDPTLKALEEFKRISPREKEDCESSHKNHEEKHEKLLNITKPCGITYPFITMHDLLISISICIV